MNSAYFSYVLHSYDLKKVLYSMGEGIRQSLNYDDLARSFILPIPTLDEQNQICNAIVFMENKVDETIETHDNTITKLEEYRKSIIYNAVAGKIDCREIV